MPNTGRGMEKYDEELEQMGLAEPLPAYINDRRQSVNNILSA